ncbi:hypothetical protein [Streptococcus sp. IMAU 99161]|uniref:hypothetical protein n=1 Tax=Streptococcus sp. IMAU 99161 TaxID=2710601 RepID=UPI00165616E8|nr:hypothetical protein [Streptococcus sp. IMAU 99161]MBC8776697.1 hypothetical protein [Streptococcus sp. IMAU 99161]
MLKDKIKFNHHLMSQLGLFTAYVLILLMSPFYIHPKIGENDSSQFTIFLGEHSLYNAKEFEGLLNSYFTISLVILLVLPAVAIVLRSILTKIGLPLLAHLQSLLIFVACSIILIYTLFSLTVQIDILQLYWGFYLCQAFYWIFILREWWNVSGIVYRRYHPSGEESAKEHQATE